MDVNGTRFHLIYGHEDWRCCRLEGQPLDLAEWDGPAAAGVRPVWRTVEWKGDALGALTLARELKHFPRGRRDLPLDPLARRGAAADAYGNWYWIGSDRQ